MGCRNGKQKEFENEFSTDENTIQTVFRQEKSNNRTSSSRKPKDSKITYATRSPANQKLRTNRKVADNESRQKIIGNQRINAKYDHKAVISKGTFSQVVRVEDRVTKQPYAIKMIDTSDGMSVFEAELSVLRRVNHPNVIHLIEMIETGGKIYMVMELATGGSLLDRLETYGHFSELDGVKILRMVLSALVYLHKMGITHRDLKPDNILYYHPGSDSKVMITDFGFSSTPKSNGDHYMHTVCGTPQYIAPEIVSRCPYTSAVDMWATGIITYIILSCTFPFHAEQESVMYKQILKVKYSLGGGVWDDVSDSAKDFIGTLIEKFPEKRLTAAKAAEHEWIKNIDQIVSQKRRKTNLRGGGSQKSSRSEASSVSRRSSRSLRSEHRRVKRTLLEALEADPELSDLVGAKDC